MSQISNARDAEKPYVFTFGELKIVGIIIATLSVLTYFTAPLALNYIVVESQGHADKVAKAQMVIMMFSAAYALILAASNLNIIGALLSGSRRQNICTGLLLIPGLYFAGYAMTGITVALGAAVKFAFNLVIPLFSLMWTGISSFLSLTHLSEVLWSPDRVLAVIATMTFLAFAGGYKCLKSSCDRSQQTN